MATPQAISDYIQHIASKLDACDNPSLSKTCKDVELIISTMNRSDRVRHLATELLRVAQDDVDISLWDTDEGRDVDSAYNFAKKRDDEPEKLEHALRTLKHDIDTFIDELKRDPSKPKKEDDDSDIMTSAPARRDITNKSTPPKSGPPSYPPKK